MKFTDEQQRIVEEASRPGRSLRIKAFAGAGKTTTLTGIAQARGERGGYMAFNRSIAQEAKQKFQGTGVVARTMHGMIYNVMRDHMEKTIPGRARCVLESGVMPGWLASSFDRDWNRYRVAALIAQSVAKWCASADPQLKREHVEEALRDMVGDPEWMPPGGARSRAERALHDMPARLVPHAEDFVQKCAEERHFSHDLYLKCAEVNPDIAAQAFRGLRYLMVDEAQDLNPVQRSILEKSGLPVIAVGDGYQQIYSWRGSQNALDSLKGEEFYLTGSFRFGEPIADVGRRILATRPDGGPAQKLEGLGPGSMAGWTGPKLGLVCRTNGGAIEAAEYMSDRFPKLSFFLDNFNHVRLEVESLEALRQGEREEIGSERVKRFENWNEALDEAEYGGDPEMSRLVKLVAEDGIGRIKRLDALRDMDEQGAHVKICTGHRAKGLEWPDVKMWDDFKGIGKLEENYDEACNKGPAEAQRALEEWNLTYVAATRAMRRVRMPFVLEEELGLAAPRKPVESRSAPEESIACTM